MIEDISSFDNAIEPNKVCEQIIAILNSSNPFSQYILTSPSETEYLISSLIDKIAMINSTSEFGFNLDELQNKLKFSYEMANQE